MSSSYDSVSLYKIKKALAELATKRGRGTELVSLYIPPRKPLHEVTAELREEYGTASNIKSDSTRNHVQDALTKTMQRLKLYDRNLPNGLAIFAGALPTNGLGSEAVKIYEVVPNKPIQTYQYRCDDHFHLEPLREMLREEKVIGILSLDTTEAGLGIVAGQRFEVADTLTSGVPGKHRAGGQSARRFERLREMHLTEYFNRVATHSSRVFLGENEISGLIVSGPGPTKEGFVKGDYLDYRLKNSILGVVDTSYAGREGVRETLNKAGKLLEEVRVIEEAKIVQRFLKEVNAEDGAVVYGLNDLIEAIKKAAVETVIVSEELGLTRIEAVCRSCGNIKVETADPSSYVAKKQNLISEPCPVCSSTEYEFNEKDIIEYIDELAIPFGSRVEVISSRTEEGSMLKSFGGVAGLLRYKS